MKHSSSQIFSSYHQILVLFTSSFSALGKEISSDELESLSGLIYQVMSGSKRVYHRPEHLLEISQGKPGPIETLAILFHDLVYVQVDHEIHDLLKPFLEGIVLKEDFSITLGSVKEVQSVAALFGVIKGRSLNTRNGLNEFLSAVVANRVLKNYLTPWEQLQVTCCIEATLPFRLKDHDGKTSSEVLYERLKTITKEMHLGKSEKERVRAIWRSVDVANRDTGGFASQVKSFISQTWDLILENNPIFLNPLYTIRQYREALQRIREFHHDLAVESIFHQFKKHPSDRVIQTLRKKALSNRMIQDTHLQTSLLAVGVLEAVSQLTGGDAPYLLFIQGEASASSSKGLKHSPLAEFLDQSLNRAELQKAIQKNSDFMESKITPMQFLKSFDKKKAKAILTQASKLAVSRRKEILKLIPVVLK